MSDYSLIIDGAKVDSGASFDVINPVDESVLATCAQGTVEHLDAAVAAAKAAFPTWSATSETERVDALNKIADLIEQHHGELSELVTKEQGKCQTGPGANIEVGGCAAWTRVTAGLELPVEVIMDNDEERIELHRPPVGVVGSITPWNWPLMIAVWHIMPALRVGCTVVIKPSPYTPLSTIRLVELINQVVPAGVVNVVTGDADVGNRMSTHPDINKIVFTGSIPTGQTIMQKAAPTLKRLTLELGGNDAGIILPGTDIEPLLDSLFWGCFINAGQTCSALKRLYVHESDYDRVCELFADYLKKVPVGNGLDEGVLVGPLTNKMQFDKVTDLVEDAKAKGGRVLCGGEPSDGPGYFYPLTLVADATNDMRLVTEEQFGTALPVIKYSDLEDAIEQANGLEVGLGASAWSNDIEAAKAVALRLQAGTCWVNRHAVLNPFAPMGGMKCSGIGVEFGAEGLKEYTNVQVLSIGK